LLSLSQVVRDNSAEFIRHVHGSHVVRTLLHVLGGCLGPPRTEARPVCSDLYKNHLKGNLVDLALHPIANFPIQRLTAASAKYKLVGDVLLMSTEPKSSLLGIILILFQFLQFLRLFDELVEGVESVLAAGHMGVIVQLAESCAESGEKQDEMMRCLLNVPLTSICYHGSRLVQALAKFKERSHLLSSLRTLSPADLLTMASDPSGSHVLQALITTSSDKGRGKILKRLEVHVHGLYRFGQYVQMACSKLGSRVLEAVWNSASVSQRQSIAQELGKADCYALSAPEQLGTFHRQTQRCRYASLIGQTLCYVVI
ncbi:hypothetical protein GOODEAATRI_007989, partial [Goodea atripinnis]